MFLRYLILIYTWLLVVCPLVQAASFDCTKAASLVEQAICRSPQLSMLDDQLMAAYTQALQHAPHQEAVRARQRTWIKDERDRCATVACLTEVYTRRIAALHTVVAASPATAAVAGTYERVEHGKPDRHPAILTIREQQDGRMHVSGNALWVGNATTGQVHTGEVEGTFPLQEHQISYADAAGEQGCQFTITFAANALRVTDDNLQCGGLHVTFNGRYRKVR